MRKTCTKCGEEKNLSGFYKSKTGKHGTTAYCRACFVVINRERREAYASRPDTEKEEKKCRKCGEVKVITEFPLDRGTPDKHTNQCRECDRAYHRERYRAVGRSTKRDPKREQEYHRERTYGISAEQYKRMLEDANHLCEICGRDPVEVSKRGACIDHCHETGKVRGILCGPCNTGIGNLRDDPAVLRKALEYLETHSVHDVVG